MRLVIVLAIGSSLLAGQAGANSAPRRPAAATPRVGAAANGPKVTTTTAKAPPTTLPAEWGFRGSLVKQDRSSVPVDLVFANRDGVLTGELYDHTAGFTTAEKFSGTYQNGQCTLDIKSGFLVTAKHFSGTCDRNGYSGTVTGKKGEFRYSFAFSGLDMAAERERQAAQLAANACPNGYDLVVDDQAGTRACQQTQTSGGMIVTRTCMSNRVRGTDTCIKQEIPSAVGAYDYIDGDDASEDGAPAPGGFAPGGAAPAPAGTVWSFGRWRWVVQPGGGCGPETQLIRGYCFGAAINELRRNPKKHDLTVIVLRQPTPPGAWVATDSPFQFAYVEVKRDGDGFKADKDLRGTSKAPIPPGCHFAPLREGFFLNAPGPQGLQEAALFRCP